ncbi:MAG: hypothetical protein J5981_05595 [Lachnospira sp.]|nr:hypothetical protein [Lachnospira sp.]
MKKRNIILEGRIKSLLRVTDVSSMTVYQQGMLLSAVEKLYKATEDEDYRQWAEEKLCELIGEDGQIKGLSGKLADYKLGSAVFALKDCDAAKKAICELAKRLAGEERSSATETCRGIFSEKLGAAYKTQEFYMLYETAFGGKEQYNDIIAQFNILRNNVYDGVCEKLGTPEADKEIAEYACAAIDTMEVMEQPLYEIYDRLRNLFKEAVAAMNNLSLKGFEENEGEAALLYAYAVLKGCRMKALHTEKYEEAALNILAAAEEKAEKSGECSAQLIAAYAESLRNREYQDYGRTKGGVLWS